MKLARLRLENFRHLGTFSNPFEITFTDELDTVRDVTLIVGPNTSGKTTILDAIAAALGPTLELATTRTSFVRDPRQIVRRGELSARVTCWLRFSEAELGAVKKLFALAGRTEAIPDVKEVKLTWTYPDDRSTHGFSRTEPSLGWTLLKGRIEVVRLLRTRRVGWDSFKDVGSVFTFDQGRTTFGKTITRQVWSIIHGEESGGDEQPRRTTDPELILLDLAIRARVPAASGVTDVSDFERVQQWYAQVCPPHRLVGVVQDGPGEFDIRFSDGRQEYWFDGLSSGERMVILLLTRFVSESIHRSIVLIDELELNQHPIWQRKLLNLVPKLGLDNQVIATTHSPYLRSALSPASIIDLGALEGAET